MWGEVPGLLSSGGDRGGGWEARALAAVVGAAIPGGRVAAQSDFKSPSPQQLQTWSRLRLFSEAYRRDRGQGMGALLLGARREDWSW